MLFYVLAAIFTALAAFIGFKAVTGATWLVRTLLSVATAVSGTLAWMFWMFPAWLRAAEQEALKQLAKYGDGSPDADSIYVGWDLREVWVQANGRILLVWAAIIGLLLLLGTPSVRARLFGNG